MEDNLRAVSLAILALVPIWTSDAVAQSGAAFGERALFSCQTAILARYPQLNARRWALEAVTAWYKDGDIVEAKSTFRQPINTGLIKEGTEEIVFLYQDANADNPYRSRENFRCYLDDTGTAIGVGKV